MKNGVLVVHCITIVLGVVVVYCITIVHVVVVVYSVLCYSNGW